MSLARCFHGAQIVARKLSSILTPSFLAATPPDSTSKRSSTTSETAWLDGLRGLAAIAVLNFHYLFAFSDIVYMGYDSKHKNFLRLPFIRLAFDGFSAVAIFFVISGYVCSLQALKRMHNREHDKLLQSFSRSIFRRGFRLYLPTLFVSFMTAIAAFLGAFESLRPMIELDALKKQYFPGPWSEPPLKKYETLLCQLRFWSSEMFTLTNIWNVGPQYLHHDPHLWTIAYGEPPRTLSSRMRAKLNVSP